MQNPVEWGREHYLFSTTVIALITAWFDIKILFMMFDSFDKGLGLAAIGIGTFFGLLLSSSVFEEHRHRHKKSKSVSDEIINNEELKKKVQQLEKKIKDDSDSSLIADVIAGRGIMRKALAGSLVITYIVLIGLSYSDATLYQQFTTPTTTENSEQTTSDGNQPESNTGNSDSIISKIIPFVFGESRTVELKDEIGITGSPASKKLEQETASTLTPSPDNEVMMKLLDKNPQSLVQHFTLVITVVIGFYFATNTLTALIKSRKSDTGNLSKKISDIEESLAEIKNNDPTEKITGIINKEISKLDIPTNETIRNLSNEINELESRLSKTGLGKPSG